MRNWLLESTHFRRFLGVQQSRARDSSVSAGLSTFSPALFTRPHKPEA
jgi:hypothetical protein